MIRVLLLPALLVAVLLAGVTTAPVKTSPVAQKSVKRCGIDKTPSYGPEGFYIVRGKVSCSRAMAISRAVRNGKGTPVDSNVSKYQGFYCGGRMGTYYCQTTRPFTDRPPGKYFHSYTCSDPGCPSRSTEDTNGV